MQSDQDSQNQNSVQAAGSDSRLLIAYFTWADNTQVDNPEEEMWMRRPLQVKISYLEKSLTTEGEPDGCDSDVGDLCLYAPWGNFSIFYQDFRYSERLIMLGYIDSGMDVISGMTDDFSATLEKAD